MIYRIILSATLATALAGCQGTTTANTKAAKPRGVPAVIEFYKAKEFVAAYNAIPDRRLAKRMYNSRAFKNKPPIEREKWVVEEFFCFIIDRCDVVTGKPSPKPTKRWVVVKEKT